MNRRLALALAFVLLRTAAQATVYTITVDSTAAPDLADWGKQAVAVCEEWYPTIIELLPSQGFQPAAEVHLVIKEMNGVAHAAGNEISISAAYVRGHRDDLGMVVHELTHVVQQYPGSAPAGFDRPGWLVEGIADYIRIVRYEPQAPRPRIDPQKASYRDAYKTTAVFLEWIAKTYDHEFVVHVNESLRLNQFHLTDFKIHTGKDVDELWAEFVKTLPE